MTEQKDKEREKEGWKEREIKARVMQDGIQDCCLLTEWAEATAKEPNGPEQINK